MKPSLQTRAEVERWWFVFCEAPEPRWWRIFVRPGFGHVYGFRMQLPDVLIALNPQVHRVENGLVFDRASDVIARAKALGNRVVVVAQPVKAYDATTDRRVGRGWLITCASMMAYVAGVNFSWRCTPYQFYRALLANGGEEL